MEADQMVGLLRRMRHDFANHLQVISGYADLGWEERLNTYVHTIIEELNQERIIFEKMDAESALYLYEQLLMVKDLGIMLVYEDLDMQSLHILKNRNEPFESVAAMQTDIISEEEDPVIYLSIYEGAAGLDLMFSCDDWEDSRRVSLVKE